MDYNTEARGRIKDGDVLAWKGNGVFSRLIQWFSRDKYSHVGLAVWLDDELFVYEAREFRGVRLERASKTLPFYWCEFERKRWNTKARNFAHARLNEPYSWRDIARIALGMKLVDNDKWICSEIVRHLLRLMKIETPDSVQTPAEVMEHLQRRDLPIYYVSHEDSN